jgi:hypothetical protein
MQKITKHSLVFILIASLVFVPFGATALAEERGMDEGISAEAMVADFVFVRPVGIVALALGSVFFVASLPFSLLGGNSKDAAKKLVVAPAKFTFSRPLGDF